MYLQDSLRLCEQGLKFVIMHFYKKEQIEQRMLKMLTCNTSNLDQNGGLKTLFLSNSL